MPISPDTGVFQRVWRFVDRFGKGDEITRADLDMALDDMTPALNLALLALAQAQAAVVQAQAAAAQAQAAAAQALVDGAMAGAAAASDASEDAAYAAAEAAAAMQAALAAAQAQEAAMATISALTSYSASGLQVLVGTPEEARTALELGNAATYDIADQAQAEVGELGTKLMSPIRTRDAIAAHMNITGGAPAFACRAWVNFDGTTGAIRASGNVSSVVRNGAGDYTVTFDVAMPDANYSLVSGATMAGDGTKGTVSIYGGYDGAANLKTPTQVRIATGSTLALSLYDYQQIDVAVFR